MQTYVKQQKSINFNWINIRNFITFLLNKQVKQRSFCNNELNTSMNNSNHRLRTIDTDEAHGSIPQQSEHVEFPKAKKESYRKISLKQANLKQVKDLSIHELVPRDKKSHPISIQPSTSNNNPINKSKIIKEIQQMSSQKQSQEGKILPKYGKNSINKSLIFSEQKLTNSHHYSVLHGSSMKINDPKHSQKQKDTNTKKHSTKGSTTKKHSKSVYNYTEFDQYPIGTKKHSTKQAMGGRKSRESYNQSALTQQHHKVSTSSVTKRVNKPKQVLNKLLNTALIKKTTSNFKILSNCLKTYIQQETMSNNKVDVGQIIKLVKAFNKTEIGQMSKPLEELIYEIVELIQDTVEKEKGYEKGVYEEKKEERFQTPQRFPKKHEQTFPSSIQRPRTHDYNQQAEIIITPNDISKTKKFTSDNHTQQKPETIHQSSLSNDLIKMQKGLQQLKSQSKQIKRIIVESSCKKTHKSEQSQDEQIEEKRIEIHRLKQILQKQKYLMSKIQNLQESDHQQESQESEAENDFGIYKRE